MNYSIKIYTNNEQDILERSIEGYIRANYDCNFPDSKAFFIAKNKTKKTFNLK